MTALSGDLRDRLLQLARAGDCDAIIRLVESWSSPSTGPAPKAMSVEDVATALGVSVRTVWRQAGLGNLDTIKIGRRTLISAASVDRLVKAGGCW